MERRDIFRPSRADHLRQRGAYVGTNHAAGTWGRADGNPETFRNAGIDELREAIGGFIAY